MGQKVYRPRPTIRNPVLASVTHRKREEPKPTGPRIHVGSHADQGRAERGARSGMAGLDFVETWSKMTPAQRQDLMASLSEEEALAILYDWATWARPNQTLPGGDWDVWLILAGRGFGKTRTGSETARIWVDESERDPHIDVLRIHLVAETAGDARDVMVEGESGILRTSPPWRMPKYEPSKRRLTWFNGDGKVIAEATTFAGKEPEQLRGPQCHKAWVDELAKYQYPDETWDNLEMGLRLGRNPQVLVTTTPKPIPLIKDLVNDPAVVLTTGSTYENVANLAPKFVKRILRKYEGTRLGEQELYARILEDVKGALWSTATIDPYRRESIPTDLDDIVVAVDPTVSDEEESETMDEAGIVVCGIRTLRAGTRHGYVLEDRTRVMSPDEWAREAVEAYWRWQATCVVAEKNQGGVLVKKAIQNVKGGEKVKVRLVWASKSKAGRAVPVAQLYEQGRIHHVGSFGQLESQLKMFLPGKYTGRGSPNNADAMIWGMMHLFGLDRNSKGPGRGRFKAQDFRTHRR